MEYKVPKHHLEEHLLIKAKNISGSILKWYLKHASMSINLGIDLLYSICSEWIHKSQTLNWALLNWTFLVKRKHQGKGFWGQLWLIRLCYYSTCLTLKLKVASSWNGKQEIHSAMCPCILLLQRQGALALIQKIKIVLPLFFLYERN